MPFVPNSFDTQFDPILNPFYKDRFTNPFPKGSQISTHDLFKGDNKFVPLSGSFAQGNFIGAALGSELSIHSYLNQVNFDARHTGITYTSVPMSSGNSPYGYLFHPKKIIDKTLNIANCIALICPPVGLLSSAFKAKLDDTGIFDLPYEIVPDWVLKPIDAKNNIPISSQKPMKVTYLTLQPSQPELEIEFPNIYEGPLLQTTLTTRPSFQGLTPESYPNINFYRKIQDLVTAISPQIYDIGQHKQSITFPYNEVIGKLHDENSLDLSASTMRNILKNMDGVSISKETYKPVTKCLGHVYRNETLVPISACPNKDARRKVRVYNEEFGKEIREKVSNIKDVKVNISDLGPHNNRDFSYSVDFFHTENASNCERYELKYEVAKTKQGVKEALEGIENDFKALGVDPDTE